SPPFSGSGSGTFTLAYKENTQIVVHFTPTSPGRYTETVAISSSDPNAPFMSLPVTGVAKPGSWRAPKSLSFGKVITGRSRKHTLTIKNLGLGVLHGSIDASSLAHGPFSIVGAAGGFTLKHGMELKIVVQFAPTA